MAGCVVAIGAAVAQHGAVEGNARHAVRGQALLFGLDQVLRRGLGHGGVRPRTLQRRAGELKQFLRRLLHKHDSK